MSSIYEVTQGTKIKITADAFTGTIDELVDSKTNQLINDDSSTTGSGTTGQTFWVDGSCATTEISFTGGQKTDIDVTSLCSTTQEVTNGLAAPAELTLSRNWAQEDPMLALLETAYEKNEVRGFYVMFPSGNGFAFRAEIRQNSWSVATAGKVTASYTLRLRDNPKRIIAVKKP